MKFDYLINDKNRRNNELSKSYKCVSITKDMKKILLIADSNMSLSGVPVVFMSIVKELHSEYLFDIIVLKDNDMYFEKEFLSYGGKIFRYNFSKPSKTFKKIKWIKYFYFKSVKKFLEDNVNLQDYCVIHSFQEDYSYPFIKLAKKAGINKRIIHINSAVSTYRLKKHFNRRLLDRYQKKAFKECSDIIFVNNQALNISNFKKKGAVVCNTYDEKKYNKLIECSHDKLVLTQIGTLSNRKNQLFSLSIMNLIKKKYPDAILKIVGNELEDAYSDKINQFILSNNLGKNVQMLEANTNKEQLYADTSFILLPSTMESFGLVLIESQACGVHCFANEDIPNDADMGNVDFIKLDSKLWAEKISNYFQFYGNKRKEPINKDKFSVEQFKKTLNELYRS